MEILVRNYHSTSDFEAPGCFEQPKCCKRRQDVWSAEHCPDLKSNVPFEIFSIRTGMFVDRAQ